jgi:hypothetical protein
MRKIRIATAEFLNELSTTFATMLTVAMIYLALSTVSALAIAFLLNHLLSNPSLTNWSGLEAAIPAMCLGTGLGFFVVGPYLTMVLMFFFRALAEKPIKKKKRKQKSKHTPLGHL